jgi:hypothetical protein
MKPNDQREAINTPEALLSEERKVELFWVYDGRSKLLPNIIDLKFVHWDNNSSVLHAKRPSSSRFGCVQKGGYEIFKVICDLQFFSEERDKS